MPDNSPLFSDIVDDGENVFVQFNGIINEDNRLMSRFAPLSGRRVVINLQQVERLNSCGIRDWVNWVQSLEAGSNRVYLVACSPAVVAQVNMVRNFCGANGRVLTFEAPYFCETCNTEHREMCDIQQAQPEGSEGSMLCQTCGEPMVFDDIPTSYFEFTKLHAKNGTPDDANFLIRRMVELKQATSVAALKEITEASRSSPQLNTPVTGTGTGTRNPTG